jgi:hypothetical protein
MTMQSTQRQGCACPNDRFTRFPNWLLGKVTGLEIAVLVALQSHYPNIHPSLATLSRESGLSQSTVQRVLGDLQRKGLMVKQQNRTKHGTKGVNSYRLLIWDQPMAETEPEAQNLEESYWSERPDGLVRETVGVWSERPLGMVTETNKEEQSNKNKDLTRKEPPLPPKGQRRDKRDDTDPYRDRDGFLVNPDHQPQATEAQPQPTQPVKPWESPQQPKPETPPEPQPALATVPVDPQPKSRKAGFTPTEGNVPAALLPVVSELLEFWASKGGKKTERAWTAQLGQLNQIQADPTGGTEAARAQLLAGVQAATFGKAWCAVTYANWQRYGRSRTPIGGTGFNRRMTQDEHAAEALAFIRERDAKRAAEAAAQETQGDLILAEVV